MRKFLPSIILLFIITLFSFKFFKNIILNIVENISELYPHIAHTFFIGIVGLILSLFLAIVLSIIMDRYNIIYSTLYPIIYISQLLPLIVIAPIYVLYFGYTPLPKILLVISGCFFPITVNMMKELKSCNKKQIEMIENLGGTDYDIFRYLKLPKAISGIISGLKISATFCFTGALIAEWLGGTKGLGIYMIIAKKSYNYTALYGATFIVILLSLFILWIINIIEKYLIKHRRSL